MSRCTLPHVYDSVIYAIERVIDGEPQGSTSIRGQALRAEMAALREQDGIVILRAQSDPWIGAVNEQFGRTDIRAFRVVHRALDLADHVERYRPLRPCIHRGTERVADEIELIWLTYSHARELGWV